MKLLDFHDSLLKRRTFGFFDDFEWYLSPHRWTALAADAGITAFALSASAECGVLSGATGTTDNNELAVATTGSPFKFAVDKPLLYEARFQYAEANTSAVNVCFGFSSVMNTANMLLDNGGGPAASFSGAILYKLDGGTVWRFRTSIGSTNTDTVSNVTAGGASYVTARIEVRESGGYIEAIPLLDTGTGLAQLTDAQSRPIKHTFAPTSAAAMQAGFYMKCGSTTAETLLVDYVAAYALR